MAVLTSTMTAEQLGQKWKYALERGLPFPTIPHRCFVSLIDLDAPFTEADLDPIGSGILVEIPVHDRPYDTPPQFWNDGREGSDVQPDSAPDRSAAVTSEVR